jgi:hypothetical protein
MHLINILWIFAFSLVLGHSNFNNTLFQWFFGFFGTPCIVIHKFGNLVNTIHGNLSTLVIQ